MARRRLEDEAGELLRRAHQLAIAHHVPVAERAKRRGRRLGYRVEGTEQCVAVVAQGHSAALQFERATESGTPHRRLAFQQAGEVVVVPRQHDLAAHADPPTEQYLELLVQERELDPAHLVGVPREDALQAVAREVAAHRRVEHLAQPVQEQRALQLIDDRAVDVDVLPLGGARLGKARHRQQNRYSAQLADELRLLRHRVDQFRVAADRIELVAARPGEEAVAEFEGRTELDQPPRAGPADLEALGRVHCLGDAEAERVDVAAQAGRRLPVDPVFDLLRRPRMVERVSGLGIAAAHDDVERREAEPRQLHDAAGRRLVGRAHKAAAFLMSRIRPNSGVRR